MRRHGEVRLVSTWLRAGLVHQVEPRLRKQTCCREGVAVQREEACINIHRRVLPVDGELTADASGRRFPW